MSRTCVKCLITLDTSNFYIRDNGKFRTECKPCHLKRNREYRSNNKHLYEKRYKEYYAKNREEIKAHVKKWRKDKPERAKLSDRNKYLKCDKKKRNETCRAWAKRNRHKTRFWSAERRKFVENQKLKNIFKKELKRIYANCPNGFVVDHIIPIKSDIVCGLHVPWNLQYLDKKVNLMKTNCFDGTYDNSGWSSCLGL
jgi:hypothetical protein